MIEIRTYTLASEEALARYAGVHWARHVPSLARHGVTTRHVWTEVGADAPRLIAVVEYAPGDDPAEVTERYMSSPEFRADMEGFAVADIVSVTTTHVVPAPSDPTAA